MNTRYAHVISQEVNGKLLLLNTRTGDYFSMNGTAGAIWALFSQSESIDAVVAKLSSTYGISSELAREDVLEFLAMLEEEQILSDLPPYKPSAAEIGELRDFFSRSRSKQLSVCIPSMDRLDLLVPCLLSLTRTAGCSEILVADSGSGCDTLSFYDDIKIKYVQVAGPFNFSKSCNRVAEAAEGELLLFLNSDTESLTADWEKTLIEFHHEGVTGAPLVYKSLTLQHVGVEAYKVEPGTAEPEFCYRPKTGNGLPIVLRHIGRGKNLEELPSVSLKRMLAVTGAFLCTDRSTFFKLDGFDEKYNADLQDIDYCLKAAENRLPIRLSKDIVFLHLQSASRGPYPFPDDDWSLFTGRWSEQLHRFAALPHQ